MKYVRRFEDGRCVKLVVEPDRVILSMFAAGVFVCPDPIRISSIPALLERLAEVATIHPDLQDFVEAVWLDSSRARLELEMAALPRGSEKTVNGILYRLGAEDYWRTDVYGELNLSMHTMAERLAAEELTALLNNTLDYEEI